jgi:hypothetical protein
MCADGREVKIASCGLAGCADKKELEKDRKGEAEAQGKFFPLTAAQRFDASTNENENGVFLGHVASLTFKGPYGWQKVGTHSWRHLHSMTTVVLHPVVPHSAAAISRHK